MPRPWWIRSFARTLGVSRRSVGTFKPRLDTLEDRTTPAVITLNNSTNPAKLSIVLDANNELLTI